MKIVFYSSNSNIFDKENFFITTLPSHFQKWKEFIKNHPEDEFYFVTEQPGMFILDSFFLMRMKFAKIIFLLKIF